MTSDDILFPQWRQWIFSIDGSLIALPSHPRNMRRLHRQMHALGFHEEFFEGKFAAFSADAAPFGAAEGQAEVADVLRVDPDHAAFESGGDAVGALDVAGPDVAC